MLPYKFAHKANEIPSEKTTETLFVCHAFYYLKSLYPYLNIMVFAPSQTDEDILGYDARFVGANFAFEVLLQFKKSELEADVFTLKPSHTPSAGDGSSQHKVLKQYPNRTAFYVAPTFKTYDDLSKKQVVNSKEFLDNYLAINVQSLTLETTRIRYHSISSGAPTLVRYLEKGRRDTHSVILSRPKDWLKGSELFQLFIAGVILKPNSKVIKFSDIDPNRDVGSLVRFNDVSNRGVTFYPSRELVGLEYGWVIDDPNFQYGVPFAQSDLDIQGARNIPNLGTSGTYVFRVYNPLLT